MSDYANLALDPPAAAELDTFLSGYVGAVIEVVARSQLDEPIAYLCLSPGQEEAMDALPLIYAGRAADRERVRRDGEHWFGTWNPYVLRDEEDLVHPLLNEADQDDYFELTPAVVQAWETVRLAIEGRRLSPEYWVTGRAAHRLNRVQLPLPATDDFVVWVFDHDAGPGELLDMLSSVVAPEKLELLRVRGIIGEDDEADYRDELG